jgi:hypothetical protein
MYQCSFELNNQPMSVFKIGERPFDAFSGLAPYVNKRLAVCIANLGPIPPGTYYIVDRESGGIFGWLYDMFGQRGDWFALYSNDGKIDDETYCNEVKRGNFRLHPKVGRGISKGCITIDHQSDFNTIRAILKGAPKQAIPGSTITAYGKVVVR